MQTVRKERKILKKLIKFSNNGKQIVSDDELGITAHTCKEHLQLT